MALGLQSEDETQEVRSSSASQADKLEEETNRVVKDEEEERVDADNQREDEKHSPNIKQADSLKELNKKQMRLEEETNGSVFSWIKMPPKILKRGRPKGAEVTVIGLPKKQKRNVAKTILPYSMLSPTEKDRYILFSLSIAAAANEALESLRYLGKEDILPLGKISDAV